jgi:signal transduction histidine kinase
LERRRLASSAGSAQPSPPPGGTPESDTSGTDTSAKDELKTRALWNTISDLVLIVRRDGVIESFQVPPDHEYLPSAEGLVGRRLMELLPTALAQQAMHYVEKTLRTGAPQTFSCQYQLPGRARLFQTRMAACGAHEVLATVRDITERAQMEKEILEISHREQMRIGQDLHDGLGQHLTGITFLSRALEKKLVARGLPEATEAAEISKLVMQALSQTRSLARGLFPVELESNGLIPAFRELASTVEKVFNIACSFQWDQALVIEDENIATHLFRLAQEAVNNAVRHGNAKRVEIEFKRQEDRALLIVRDDGAGFSTQEAKPQGLGLRIMQYRAQKIGGTLAVESNAPRGVTVSCAFALPAVEPGQAL